MNRMKKILALVLALATCVSMSTTVFESSNSESHQNTISSIKQNAESNNTEHGFAAEMRSTNSVINDSFSGTGTGSWDKSFSTSKSQPVYNITVKNTGIQTITVFVNKGSPNGDTQTSFTVAPGTTGESGAMTTDNFWNKPGTRYLIITSKDQNAYKGAAKAVIASNTSEV